MSLKMPHGATGEVLPLRHRPGRRRRGRPLTGRCAEVYDLAWEREQRIPAEVLEAMDQADALWEQLEAAGLHVHFDLTEDGVRAMLADDAGGVVRALTLAEVLDPTDLPPDAA